MPEDVTTRPGAMILRVVAAATGEPIPGASVDYAMTVLKTTQQGKLRTDRQGDATIEYVPGLPMSAFTFTVRVPGFVPYYVLQLDDRRPIEVPPFKAIELQPAHTIEGIVQNDSGDPIPGAEVRVYMRATEYEGTGVVFDLEKTATDETGQWETAWAPEDLSGLRLRVSHSEYMEFIGVFPTMLDGRVTLRRGVDVRGKVTDAEGNPITFAEILVGPSRSSIGARTASTDDQGEFIVENCPRGSGNLTATSSSYAPTLIAVNVTDDMPSVHVQMDQGQTIRLRVVNVAGDPVQGAYVLIDSWRDSRTLSIRGRTDAEGRWVWDHAPEEPIRYRIGKMDLLAARSFELGPSVEEHTLTLYPVLVISGRVVDDETEQPISKLRIWVGTRFTASRSASWGGNIRHEFEGGWYRLTLDQPAAAYQFRIEADGYKTFESREFLTTEGDVQYDVRLKAASTPDSPAAPESR